MVLSCCCRKACRPCWFISSFARSLMSLAMAMLFISLDMDRNNSKARCLMRCFDSIFILSAGFSGRCVAVVLTRSVGSVVCSIVMSNPSAPSAFFAMAVHSCFMESIRTLNSLSFADGTLSVTGFAQIWKALSITVWSLFPVILNFPLARTSAVCSLPGRSITCNISPTTPY